jgi:hypothetical protein
MNRLYPICYVEIFPAPEASAFMVQRLCDNLFLELLQLKRAMNNMDRKVKRAATVTERDAFVWLMHQYQQTFQGLQSRLTQLQRESRR